jgi:hypothetical protein
MRENAFSRNKSQLFVQGLCDEHPIERITMRAGQTSGDLRVAKRDRQLLKSLLRSCPDHIGR